MGELDRRLTALEQQRAEADRVKGIRIFQQSEDTPEVFYELAGTAFYAGPQGYTRGDLRVLSALGWQLIMVVYGAVEARAGNSLSKERFY